MKNIFIYTALLIIQNYQNLCFDNHDDVGTTSNDAKVIKAHVNPADGIPISGSMNNHDDAKVIKPSNGLFVSGSVIFNSPPKLNGKRAHATVQIEDTSRMDVASIIVASKKFDFEEDDIVDNSLPYDLVLHKKIEEETTYSLTAIINIDWIPSGDEWIHKGDYFSMTNVNLVIPPGPKRLIGRNINVDLYS